MFVIVCGSRSMVDLLSSQMARNVSVLLWLFTIVNVIQQRRRHLMHWVMFWPHQGTKWNGEFQWCCVALGSRFWVFFVLASEFCRECENCERGPRADGSWAKKMGKPMAQLLRHNWGVPEKLDKGAMSLHDLLETQDHGETHMVQLQQRRSFAALRNGNKKQRFFIDVDLTDDWYPSSRYSPWEIRIGATQSHTVGEGVITPEDTSQAL